MATKQLLRLTLLLAIASIQAEHGQVHVPVSFKRIGKFASGLSHCHIRTVIDFKKVDLAHAELANLLLNERANVASKEDKHILEMLSHQFSASTSIINRLRSTFFHDGNARPKRQLFAGVSFLTGILSFGTSIYNRIEISRIHSELSNLEQGTKHIAKIIEEQDHAISTLTHSVNIIKQTVKLLLQEGSQQKEELLSLKRFVILSTLLTTHSAEISAWGRGLEALLEGRLHPTLVNHAKLQEALQSLSRAAGRHGLKPLHLDPSAIFKSDISYVATQENQIIVYVHLPYVDSEPLDLFEHLPVPFEHEQLLLMVDSEKNVIASDEIGMFGTELSSSDLLHCHSVKTHHGNVYACPHSNLLNRQIRKTCLGSLLFGDTTTAAQTCRQRVQRAETTEDFAIQIRPETLVVYSKSNSTVVETCSNGTKKLQMVAGLTVVSATKGCKMSGKSFLLKPELSIFSEADIFDSVATFNVQDLMPVEGPNPVDLRRALEEIEKIDKVKPRSIAELHTWMENSDRSFRSNAVNVAMASSAILLTLGLVIFISWQYCKYSRVNASLQEKSAK
jgi:hypothetical protein